MKVFPASTKIMKIYSPIILTKKDNVSLVGTTFPIPFFEESIISDLCNETISKLKGSSALIRINSHCTIAGDLHGNLFDLIRIIKATDFSNNGNLIFLGDYVDRGKFSIETVVLLFALFCTYPNCVHLLRGNHEFANINSQNNFRDDIIEKYQSDSLWKKINSVFDYLPIAALIQKQVFCVHGGISSYLYNIDDIDDIELPMSQYYLSGIVEDLMWSDPNPNVSYYAPSSRGNGHLFGREAIKDFLLSNNIKHIVRAHQVVRSGVEKFAGNSLFTTFSSSNYLGQGNKCGLIVVNDSCQISALLLPPIPITKNPKFAFVNNTKLNCRCNS
ncbi:hypothetical protein M9Y10_002271 [Tritrichomonas musculus]|uniref:Serine/threonine-protein phosphatase n=1 Tax=Tritrichomonas musculus TaxID=1915356 RepID=A0ABR2L9B9_9EUKA